MASPPPGPVEDQTDADFFDNLVVDDEFGVARSGSVSGDMTRDFSNLNIGDMGTPAEDLVDTFEAEDGQDGVNTPSPETPQKDGLDMEESVSHVSPDTITFDKVVPPSYPVEMTGEVGCSVSSIGKSAGSKCTSVKEVQWSSFSSDHAQFDMGGFGSYMDFFSAFPDGSAEGQMVKTDSIGVPKDKPLADPSTYLGSLEQLDDQAHVVANERTAYLGSKERQNVQAYEATNEQVAAGNDSQYWENLYPGLKYDAKSGKWYKGDSCGTTEDAQVNGYDTTTANSQVGFQEKTQLAGGVVEEQRSNISYLQQTAQSVESVAESCTGSVSNWNQVTRGSTEYLPNMVFDSKYPGWYYDLNTEAWYTLESYFLSIQTTSTVQNQPAQDVGASLDFLPSEKNHALYNNETICQESGGEWGESSSNYSQQNMWQPEVDDKSGLAAAFSGNHATGNFYGSVNHERSYADQQNGFKTTENVNNHNYGGKNGTLALPGFVPAESTYQFNQSKVEQIQQPNIPQNYYLTQNSIDHSQQPFQSGSVTYSQFSYTPHGGRSSAGRPPHALVTFGFGGKLIVMKDTTFGSSLPHGSQDSRGGIISVLNLVEVVTEKTDSSNVGTHSCGYFHTLCKQSFPGPLVGGNAASKDLNKWIDERIASCQSSIMEFRNGELLRLLLSLLKISCQHYGKLRSPFGADPSLQETDGPESDLTKLFASSRKNGAHLREYCAFTHCMHNLPSEGQIRTTAVEVQNLLVSGRRKEALQCAQEGQLWGPALVLAAQLGEKFYVDTVKRMARHQFVSGSPLRTLCLLIAGQPADVFSVDTSNSNLTGAVHMWQQPAQAPGNGMLDDWEENLGIIIANRTKDDELVIVHLGDCMWKERGEIIAAHTCYLVAEANFESYSDSARLCLIGADHWKCPRTYASPEAIQRTELYEYSKVLGNSQFILLPFQPYKLVYAYMLAEVGKISDSLKYCRAILKSLKNSGRAPEVETWKLLVSSLEERLQTNQQGGYGTNLAPAKLVGKIFTSIDRSIHRMIGAPPPPLPPMPQSNIQTNEHGYFSMAPKVTNSQSTVAMSSLIPSASVQTISELTGDNKKTMHNRSISEPDFGRSPKQGQVNPPNDASSTDSRNITAGASSRFGRFGSQLFQKTMGWVSRSHPDCQAKLGERNKFYYDEKLKRWVEEGAEPPAEEVALPPPPPSFQNGVPEYNINSAFISQSLPANGGLGIKTSNSSEHSPGIPPMPPSQNQFSARGRMGVRSRYVDTFNKGGGLTATSFQSPSVPSVKPVGAAKFFIPTPAASGEPTADATEITQEVSSTDDTATSVAKEFSSSFTSSSSSLPMHRFPSMDNIAPIRNKGMGAALQNMNDSLSFQTRAASWSGIYSDTSNHQITDSKPLGDGFGVPSSFMPNALHPTSSTPQANGSSLGDELHEVEL